MTAKNLLGIFDSGIGGFSVYKEIRKNTTADILYYGDCARAPYGNKTEEEIVLYIKEILQYLASKGVSQYISACNSMSVLTTKTLLKDVGISEENYFDMISAVDHVPVHSIKKVLIIGTVATIRQEIYQNIFSSKNISYEVCTPITLAGNIEKGDIALITEDCKTIIAIAKKVHATHILYACTHYPLAHEYFLEAATLQTWSGVFIDPAIYLGQIISNLAITGKENSIFETSLITEGFVRCVKKYQ